LVKLLVDRLTTTPTPFRHEGTADWWTEWSGQSADPAFSLAEPYEFDFEAHAMAEDIFIAGRMSGAVEIECGRCLKRYRQALRDEYRLVLEPARDRLPPDPESADALKRYGLCLGLDLETGWYRGKELVLDPFLAEVVSLALPVQPLCREDCAGLCPHCGVDRSQESCSCTDSKPESPFAVLAALREGPEGSS